MYTIPYCIKDLVEFLLSAYSYYLLHLHIYMYDKVHVLVYLTFFDYTSSASGTGAKGSHSVTLGEGEQTLPYVHLKEIVYKQILIWFSLNAAFFLPVLCVSDNFNPGRSRIIHPSPNNKYKALWSSVGKGLHWLLESFQGLPISSFMLSHWQNVSQIKTTKITQIYPLAYLCNKLIPLFLVNYLKQIGILLFPM